MKRKVIGFFVLFAIFVALLGILQLIRFGGILGFVIISAGPSEGQTTIMLQTANSENLGDVQVSSSSPNSNLNSLTALTTSAGVLNRSSYIKFNISAVPSGQAIDNSSLCLYLYSDSGANTISIYQVYSDWSETALTWNNQICGIAFNDSANCNLSALSTLSNNGTMSGKWMCWDILGAVKNQYALGSNNVSFILRTFEFNLADSFYTKEYTNTSLFPYLNITYSAAITNSAPAINIASPADNENLSYNESVGINYSVSDADGNLDSCWYKIDNGNNILISNCANATFNALEGSHNLSIYANDSYNEIASDSVSFSILLNNSSPMNNSGNETNNESAPETPAPSGGGSGGGGGGSSSGFIINKVKPAVNETPEIPAPAINKSINFEIIDYERVGNELIVNYKTDFAGAEEITLNYNLFDLDEIVLAKGLNIALNNSGNSAFIIALPKNAFGEFKLEISLSDGANEKSFVKDIFIPSKGVTGFALFVKENRKMLSLIGTIAVSVLALFFVARFIYNYHRRVSGLDRKKRHFIDLDFRE